MIIDKNGTEIHEGDRVLVTKSYGSFEAKIFKQGGWMYGKGCHPYLPLYCEKYPLTEQSDVEVINPQNIS